MLLVNPPAPGSMGCASLKPGLGYIAESLEKAGIGCDVQDMDLGYTNRHLRHKIDRFMPDLIGITMVTYRYREAYRVINYIKQLHNNIPIVAGGPHICTIGKQVLAECSSIDYAVSGEGEDTVVELCQGKEPSRIKGLIYSDGKRIIANNKRPPISNLDRLPFPRYERFELGKYVGRSIPIVSSRGCPYQCSFCTVSNSMGRRIRTRSPQNVVDEMAYWYGKGRRRFGFVDDNLTFYPERVFAICDEIERRNLNGLNLRCTNGIRADRATKKFLSRMKEVGFSAIGIGVESGSQSVLKKINKNEELSKIEETIQEACALGYDTILHFVVGAPGETMNDVRKSFELARRYPVRAVYFNSLIPYPRTPLYDSVREEGGFLFDPKQYLNSGTPLSGIPVFETSELPKTERIRALKDAETVERKVRTLYFKRRYKRLGPLSFPLARVLASLDRAREARPVRLFLRFMKPI